MVHCKDCKHWSKPGTFGNYSSDTHGTCELITTNQHKDDEDPTNMAESVDFESCGALLTRPEFACILGEAKETTHED